MLSTRHLVIKGKVQGVYYRVSARDQAVKLGLTGWVKNTPAGDVEVVVSGHPDIIDRFIQWCRQGPPHAEVEDVIIEAIAPQQFEGFDIAR